MFSSMAGISNNVFLRHDDDDDEEEEEEDEKKNWNCVLPYETWSHDSVKIFVNEDPIFDRSSFSDRLQDTIHAMKEMGKSSIWVEVPMQQAGFIEDMMDLGFTFHHAQGYTANLNLWLRKDSNKVPEFATHHVGVGAVVVNSRDEILCVRELRHNFMPWKVPGGLADLGEHIPEAAEREVYEETGIRAKFHSILSFRHAHGLANGRSDLFFVCRLDPIEERDEDGNVVIPTPVPQECEIAAAEWIPLSDYKDMVNGVTTKTGHPMMRHVMDLLEKGVHIGQRDINSFIPGRANPMYHPVLPEEA